MSKTKQRICVVGSGAWGTAIAMLLDRNGHEVTLWSFESDIAQIMTETQVNPRLPGVTLPKSITHTDDISCVADFPIIVMVPPSFAVRQTARKMAPYLSKDTVIVSASKGIENGTGLRMSEIIAGETGCRVAAISGPCHAEEVSRGIPTGCDVACADRELVRLLQDIFMSPRFRVYAMPDVVGAELGGALKNVIALCGGICDGMGFGDNTKALLMTRGLTEIARLGMALGSRQETFAGLTGVGDLIVTCCSMHSRNHRAGILIGQGMDVQEAMASVGGVVEGYYAAKSAMELAERAGVEMPITQQAYEVLYNGKSAREAIEALMLRQRADENEDAGWYEKDTK